MQQTKYMRIVAAGLLMTLFAACAKDDTIVPYDTTEGIPCTVTLNVGAAPAPEITVTRADNSLSTLSSLKIFVYDKDGQVCQNVTTLSSTDITENGTYRNGNGETLYKVSIETTSGEKQLFAIANYGSGYWDQSGIEKLCSQAEQGALTLAQLRDGVISLANNNFNINTDGNLNLPSITASNQMLISGWNTEVVFAAENDGTGTVTKYGTRGDPKGSVAIKMQRSMARITFNIAAEVDGASGIFRPSTFRVYNIPRSTWLAANFDSNVKRDSDDIQTTYLTSALTNVGSLDENKYSFTFYMPENIQESKEGLTNYNQRDMWDGNSGSATLPQNKKWTNAPQNSTFVVINGTYASNDGKYSGTVNYTVHLGDFGDGGSMGNFSIERNYAYTYNMKVLGVHNIIVEAQRGDNAEYQHGAEGDIYDAKNCIYNYNLDAHYEQVYLEYDISSIAASVGEVGEYNTEKELDDAIANKLVLVIQSEAMDHNADGVVNKRGSVKPYQIYADSVRGDTDDGKQAVMEGAGSSGKPTKGFDYKWIEFYPQSSTEISPYPGVPSWNVDHDLKPDPFDGYKPDRDAETLMDAYDVCVALGKAVKELKKNPTISTGRNDDGIIITNDGGKYVARFTAFVNEYYYYRHPLTHEKLTTWSVLTNKIPREMIIAMSTDVSADGNSSYSQIYSYISQLSMQTFYNSRSMAINAFGIETYNETPIIPFGSPAVKGTLDDSDGRNNQIRLLNEDPDGKQYGDWNNYIDASQNGWYSTTSTDRTKHKLKESAYKGADQTGDASAYYACLSRNRDLNGNGKIDDNEVRWYLASLNEYIRMGIGAGAISNAAQLYMGDKSMMVKESYPSEYINLGSLYYTSSSADKRVYWAVEKGSYGAVGSSYNGANLPIRCIRILPAIEEGVQDASAVYGIVATPTVVQEEKNGMIVLNFKGRLVDDLYRGYVEGSLGPHDEDDDENSFYEGVFVAKDYLRDKSGDILTYILKDVIGAGVSMVNPCAGYSEGGYDNWRVPNLVELSAMNALGLLNECKDNNGDTNYQAISCTQFSNLAVRYGFARSSLLFCPGGNGNELEKTYRIRCVRDVPPGSTLLE